MSLGAPLNIRQLRHFDSFPRHAKEVENAAEPKLPRCQASFAQDNRHSGQEQVLSMGRFAHDSGGLSGHHQRTHGVAASHKIQEGVHESATQGESSSGRMWNPAEVFLFDNLESLSLERQGVLFKRRQIALNWI